MKKFNVTVKKAFLDRYTGIKHKQGDKLTLTEARYREIKRSGDYVEMVKTSPLPEAKTEIKKDK